MPEPTGPVTTYQGDNSTETHNFNAEIPADATFVTIHYGVRRNTATVVSVTVDGEPATQIWADTDGSAIAASVWGREAPAVGASVPISVTINTGSAGRDLFVVVRAWTGVGSPAVGTVVSESGEETNKPTISVPSNEGDLALAFLAIQRASGAAVDSPSNEEYTYGTNTAADANRMRGTLGSRSASGESTDVAFTLSDTGSSRPWLLSGFSLLAGAEPSLTPAVNTIEFSGLS